MALNSKGSRPIQVAGRDYRYVITEGGAQNNGWLDRRVTVQAARGDGSKLLATTRSRSFWLDFPEIQADDSYVVITPKKVAAIVVQALEAGWDPTSSGPVFNVTLPKWSKKTICE